MKRWINSLFFSRSTTKKIAHWNHMCNTKIEYKKIVMHKKQSYFFASHNNDILILFYFIFFWYVIIFLFLQDNKNISPWYNILNNVQNKKMVSNEKHFFVKKKTDVAEKVVWCHQKQVNIARKEFHVSKKKLILHKKSISCRQK